MTVIKERMDAGIPGDVSRKLTARIEGNILVADLPYGSPVQLDAGGKIVALYDEAAPVYGFIVRPYPAQSTRNDFGAGSAPKERVVDVLRSGYMTVKLVGSGSAIVKGAPVQAVFEAGAGVAVGDIVATGGVEVSGCIFMGPPDANNNTEIAFNI